MGTLWSLVGKLGLDNTQYLAGLESSAMAADSAAAHANSSFGSVAGQLGILGAAVGVFAGGIAAIKISGDFQNQLTQLVTGAGEAESNIGMIRDGLLAMAGEVGQTPEELAQGLYMIESAGYHGAAGLEVLKTAAEGAKVGGADMATVADALTSALNAYHLPAADATAVTNDLIATVASGKMHMQDLASSLGAVLPAASTAGISLADVSAAIATMTAQGTPAADAATYLRQTILMLENPSAKAQAAMASIGLTAADVSASLRQNGLQGTLAMMTDDLSNKFPVGSQKYISTLAEMVGGTKSMQAALELTGGSMATYEANLAAISQAYEHGGNAVSGWNLVQADFNTKMDDLKAGVQAAGITIGTQLLPVVTPLVGTLANGINPAAHDLVGLVQALSSHMNVLGPMLLTVAGGFVAIRTAMLLQAIVSGLIGAYTALTGVMAGLAAGEDLASIAATALGSAELIALAPMLLIVAAIAAVIAIGYLLITHWSQVTAAAQAVWVEIQKIWGDIEAFVGHAVQGILDWLGAHWPLVISIVLGPLGAVLALVITHWTQIHDFIATAIADVESFLSNTWNRIVSAAETAWSQFASRPLYWIGYLLVWIPLTILKIEAAIFEWFMNLIDMAEQKAADFVGSIINWITTLPGAIAGFLSQAWTNVTAWAGQMVASAQTTGSNFLAAVVNEIQQLPGQVWAFLLNTYNGLVTWAGDMLTQAQQAATSVVSAIVTEIGQLPAQMVQTGSDIVKGLWNGISSMGGWIEQQVGNFAGGILDGFKGALGIKSPSTVMAQQVGLPIAQGIANGILSGQDLVIAASKQVTGAALSASAAMAGGSTFSGINSQQMQPFGSGSISSSAMADQFVAVIGANLASQLGLGNNMAQQVGLAALINGPLASKVGVNPASVLNMDLTTLQKPGGIEDAVFGALQGMDEGQLLDALGQTRPGAISTTYNLTINGEPDSATLQQLQQMLEQHTQDVAQALTAGA